MFLILFNVLTFSTQILISYYLSHFSIIQVPRFAIFGTLSKLLIDIGIFADDHNFCLVCNESHFI